MDIEDEFFQDVVVLGERVKVEVPVLGRNCEGAGAWEHAPYQRNV
jgi:hypothetical protein